MNITLVDTTAKRFRQFVPLALLRLATRHKNAGDMVELVSAGRAPFKYPDIIYFSFIFLFDYRKDARYVLSYRVRFPRAKIIVGGISPTLIKGKFEKHFAGKNIEIFTGRNLELEQEKPDFEIAKVQYSYSFTTRGCPNKCDWCVVPKLEGRHVVVPNWKNQVDTSLKIWYAFDNNVLACGANHFESVLKFCQQHRIKIDFNQAMDAEIFHRNKKIPPLFLRYPNVWEVLRFAWDSDRVEESIIYVMDFLHLNGISANTKSLLMLYDANDSPETVFKRIQTVLQHPARFGMKLMRFQDLETGLLRRNWGGVGDLFADALGFAVTGVISPGTYWNYMFAGDLNDFLKKASYIREYLTTCDKKKSVDFMMFALRKMYPLESITDVNNVNG